MNIIDFILQQLPAIIIALPLLAAFLTPIIDRFNKRIRDAFIIIVLVMEEIFVLILTHDVITTGIHIYTMGASSPTEIIPTQAVVPIRIVLEVDGMSVFMALISATVSLVAGIYSLSFIREDGGKGKFYTLLLLILVGMLGMELTGDMFNMFVFLEVLSIACASLIAYRSHFSDTVEGAFKFLVISTISALFVLFAIALLYAQYDLLNIAALAHVIKYTYLDKIALALLIAAFAMKCGSVPMHFWTPDAYSAAPASITATLVVASQASLYALFRVCFTLYGSALNLTIVGAVIIIFGLLSMFIGVIMAIPQKDIKRLMAYHAISQTGYMLLGVGVGLYLISKPEFSSYGIKAMEGGVFHIINHAMYKGLLFLTAGAIYYRLKTRNLNEMGGLGHSMKYTSIFFIIGAMAIAGIPPFNGFSSKLLIYEAAYKVSPILSIIAMLVSILTLASFVKVFHSAFMGPKIHDVEEVPKSMLIAMGLLAFLIIFFGLFPDLIVKNLVEPAVNALVNHNSYLLPLMGGV
ncbi:NADH:ubiquinone oxidoreductase [candidate division WOR-3 bacterium]|nr:NADH:ubiquinone oxidoreductase [candidate division WOR-3 bacterium]